jgi:RimJ/RimL family protein N-acetyltransferase
MAAALAEVAEEGMLGTEPPVDVGDRAARFRAAMEDGSATIWVVAEGERVLGSAGLHQTRVDGVLSLGMSLVGEARGRGLGTALLETMIAHARQAGAHKVELEAWPENTRAIALYERFGFEHEGLRRGHYRRRDGSLRSAVVMGLLLGEA